ncbi:alanyl-tRNA synthetase [Elusimicrobium simillimum]|uniref:alanine--tRNA ligase n=1 Tax=Elusimicrobium simillimum TaxID=3143438 RepID=UPI003C6F5EAF
MNSKDIRESYLQFFKSKDCTIVPSSSLIPEADPTLLFTSAGMVQFKANFLGLDKSLKRAVSCQKCVRTTDIDSVGFTNRHLTFFEMLGNFSFGDYFKEEAIAWAWEYLTVTLKMPKEKLFASIYKGGIAQRDEEAYNIWLKYVDKDRIFELGEKDNFWTMGPTGPCGPCSEIYFDFGDKGCTNKNCDITCDCGRYVEIWNIVFTQFDRKEDGKIVPLAQKNIDTGMGFERLTMAMQGTKSLYETDLFSPLTDAAKKILNIKGDTKEETATLRIVADHARSSSFLIAEGILPANDGRGYILRRLVRRALRYGKMAGAKGPFLYNLVDIVDREFGDVYPEIRNNKDYIKQVIKTEEESFFKTLENGEEKLEEILKRNPKIVTGEEAFYLYETYGFPVELTKEIAGLKGIGIDEAKFEEAKKAARDKSRSYADEFAKEKLVVLQRLEVAYKNTFVGYDTLSTKAVILGLLNDKFETVDTLDGSGYCVLDKTPFYATGGGQIGDKGTIASTEFSAKVTATERPLGSIILHSITTNGPLSVGDNVIAEVDLLNRRKTAANHTSIHLVNEALHQVLGKGVHQAGSFVSDEVFRFDYTTPKAPTPEQLKEVFAIANTAVQDAHQVSCELRPLSDAAKFGAVTLVGEKYADPARFVLVGGDFESTDLKYSLELCGGTHVQNTAEIMTILLLKESALSAGVRRIEGVAGLSAIEYLNAMRAIVDDLAKTYTVPATEVGARVNASMEELKAAKKEITALRQKMLTGGSASTTTEETLKDGSKLVAFYAEGASPKELRSIADNLSHKHKDSVVLIAVDDNGKRSFVVKKAGASTADACGLAKSLAEDLGGRAGGKDDFAQGGCQIIDWKEFLNKAKDILS